MPAKLSLADTLGDDDEVAQAIAAAAGNAKLTPASPNWADVEAAGILQDLFVKIAQGGDVAALAAAADEEIEDDPQQLAGASGCRGAAAGSPSAVAPPSLDPQEFPMTTVDHGTRRGAQRHRGRAPDGAARPDSPRPRRRRGGLTPYALLTPAHHRAGPRSSAGPWSS